MKLLRYEIEKLFRYKIFVLLTVFLLIGNVLALLSYERRSEAFFHVVRQGESFQEFLSGTLPAEESSFFRAELDRQEAYFQSYDIFLTEMKDRAKMQEGFSIFSASDGFTAGNRTKTVEDFNSLEGISLQSGNQFAIRAFAEYEMGFFSLMIFLSSAVFFTIFREKEMRIFPLLKASKKGHISLAAAKLMTVQVVAAIFVLLQEGLTVLLLGYLYGWGELQSPIQSVSLFRGCIFRLSVGEAVLVIVVVRILLAVLLAACLGAVGFFFQSELSAILFLAAAGGFFYLCYYMLPLSGRLSMLKCVNPFYSWNMWRSIGEYHNLNILDHPVSKTGVQIGFGVFLYVLSMFLAVVFFCTMQQVRRESIVEEVIIRLRRKTGFLRRQTSLLYYEIFKSMCQQKKILAVGILILLGLAQSRDALGTVYYAKPEEAAYHYYMDWIEGAVTESTIQYLQEEERRFAEQRAEIARLEASESEADRMQAYVLRNTLQVYEGGLTLVWKQYQKLTDDEATGPGKYMIDEAAYQKLWGRRKQNIIYWMECACLGIFLISGLYPYDKKRGMLSILRTTRQGEPGLRRAKQYCAVIYMAFVFVVYEIPNLIRLFRIDGLKCMGATLADFTAMQCPVRWTIGMVAGLTLVFRVLSFVLVGVLGMKLSRVFENEYIALLVSVGIVLSVGSFCYLLSVDFISVLSIVGEQMPWGPTE